MTDRVMRIEDLPAPPAGKTGWPWTEGCAPLPDKIEGAAWPRITLVTPTYNHAQHIEHAIRSVLLQGYPNLEYFVMDGGSNDDSAAIIRKYERWLDGWVSEKDRGQTHAINKGFTRATGDVINWICSDDYLPKDALGIIGRAFAADPDLDVLCGASEMLFPPGPTENFVFSTQQQDVALIPFGNPVAQPSTYYRRRLLNRTGPLDESYNFLMDMELWAYFNSKGAKWRCIPDVLAFINQTGVNKTYTGGNKTLDEHDRLFKQYVHQFLPLPFFVRRVCMPLAGARNRRQGRSSARFYDFLLTKTWRLLGRLYGHDRVAANGRVYFEIAERCGVKF